MKKAINFRFSIIFIVIFSFCLSIFAQSEEKTLTILHTNDFHTQFDPIPAYWLKGSPKLGGAAHITTLINQIRAKEKAVFLFDTGDMFTGQMSFLTKGEALMEMMMSMKYDAMAIGNHEFDYGSDNFTKQMDRVPFPILGANIFYKDSGVRYSRPYTILEKDGVRLGVIGIIGMDARSVALPSGVTNIDFKDPIPIVRKHVKELKPYVDLIVVLAHQGNTGPMQTDAENRPEVQRDFDEDIRLTTEVKGIDVFVGGHAHRGIETPFVNPKTGTIIVQTYGYGTRLGYLKVKVKDKKMVSHKGELLKVWSDKLKPDPVVAAKVDYYKKLLAPKIGIQVGTLKVRLVRDYNHESSFGNFVTDVMREITKADLAMTNAGGLRADLPEGKVTNGDVLDALPFVNLVDIREVTGRQIKEILEQSLSLKRGMMQVSGIRVVYDLKKPIGQRLVNLKIGGKDVIDDKVYRVATNSFVGEGGDLYQTFLKTKLIWQGELLSTTVINYLKKNKNVGLPKAGRLIPVK